MSLGSSSAPPPPPTQTTTRQVPEYAPEQREYVRDIFGKAQELYEQRTEEGFQPFPGPQLAPFAAQEEEAFRGIESLARGPGAAPVFEVARTAALGAAAPVTAGEIQGLMNPYQQAVTDIAKREAVRQYQRGPQAQLRTGAVESGGLRGARRFIEEAEGQRNLQQQLSDIQTMGGQQAYNQAMAEAAAARGRLANLAQQMPAIGTGAYQQSMAQLGQLGGVGEARRAREQAAIDLAQQQFQRELMFPEETLATYLRFITNAPSPSGFQRDVIAPGVRGPSAITQLGGLAGGLGTLAGGLGGKRGLLNLKSGGAVGRQAGLSGIVRRAGGGQIVRMQDGGSPFIEDIKKIGPAIREFMSGNIQNVMQDAETSFPVRAEEYLFGSQEELDRINKMREAEIKPEEPTTSTKKLEDAETQPVADKAVSEEPEVENKEQSLAERYAEYRQLMEGDDTESELSWPERLQIASAFFSAADTPGTGSFLGDLSQFGAAVTPGVAKGLAARDARELAAKKARIQSVKDFRDFVREEKLDAREAAALAAEINLKRAKTEEASAKAAKERGAFLEYPDKPAIALIQEAEQVLENIGGYKYDETKFDKQRITKPGTLGYDIAMLSQMQKISPRDLIPILENIPGAIIKDNKGRSSLNRDMFFGGGRKVIQSKAGGGRVDDRPVLRYPEDF